MDGQLRAYLRVVGNRMDTRVVRSLNPLNWRSLLPRRWLGVTLVAAAITGSASRAPTAEMLSSGVGWHEEAGPGRNIVVTVNKSKTLWIDKVFATAVVGSTDIADALPLTGHTLYIQGKKVGTTNVTVYDQNSALVGVLDVEIAPDVGNLQQKIRIATDSNAIHVSSSNGQVVLAGTAVDAVAADRALAMAKTLSPNGVINAMSVAPSQQVSLKVRFLEASRNGGREVGVNWFQSTSNGTRGITTGNLTAGTPPQISNGTLSQVPPGLNVFNNTPGIPPIFQAAGTLLGTTSAPFGVVLANLVNGGTKIDVLVTALETQGLVRRLAEPNLMALSGDTAKFLAGGQFPVPIAATSANGIVTPTIEFKNFGVQLSFTPTVLSKGIINLRIAPEVSELDFSNAVTISGTTIPSLITRNAVTTVELRDGQSFAIAGLLQADDTRGRSQIPWLGSVPVLGALFSSNSYVKNESDLVIIVTPQLVQPAAPGQRLATPLDDRIPSNDADFFLMSQMDEKKKRSEFFTSDGQRIGPYGHIIQVVPTPNQ